MIYLGDYRIDDYITFGAQLHRFSSGAVYAPTGDATYTFYENNSTSGAPTGGNLAQLNTKTGLYTARVQLSAANGFEAGKDYFIHLEATVDGVAAAELFSFRVIANPKVDVDTIKTQSITCGAGVTVLASVGTASTSTAQTGDSFARIGANGASLTALPWNAAWDAEVESECTDALAAVYLDRLVKNAVLTDWGTTVTQNSVIGLIAAKDGFNTFDRTTDSLEALRNRGDAAWITATGFSTHSAADVWAAATRTLTAGSNIVLAKGVGVTGFNDLDATAVTGAVPTTAQIKTAIEAAGGHLALILEDTGTTIPGAMALDATVAKAATALSNVTWTDTKAGYLDAAVTSRLASGSYTAPDNAGIAAVKAVTDQMVFTTPNRIDASATVSIGPSDIEDIADAVVAGLGSLTDPLLNAVPGSYAAGTAGYIIGTTVARGMGGAGAIRWTYTLLTTPGGLPIADADVWVTTDSAGANIIASGRTDQNGLVVFYLNAGTVYVWAQKSGINFTNPDMEVVT